MNFKWNFALLLSALTFASGAAATGTVLGARCSNWQTGQTFTVHADCTTINGNSVQASMNVDLCVHYQDFGSGRDYLTVGAKTDRGYDETVSHQCSACGIYKDGLVCRCQGHGNKYWSNPLPLDSVFKVNDDGTLACVSPVNG